MSESTGGRPALDHQLTIDMAKEICMIQRSEIGKKCRQYFIEVEKKFKEKSSTAIDASTFFEYLQRPDGLTNLLAYAKDTTEALKKSEAKVNQLTTQRDELQVLNIAQKCQISELAPKANYTDKVLSANSLISTTIIAKEYGLSAIGLNRYLREKHIIYPQDGTYCLYQKYTGKNYAAYATTTRTNPDGSISTYRSLKWTEAGRYFISKLLESEGYKRENTRQLPYNEVVNIDDLPER